MQYLKSLSWTEVFDGWREREAQNPGWVEVATKVKGWPDWESWRGFTAQQINASSRQWDIFSFEDPLREVTQMLIGPYTGWQDRVFSKNATTFADLLTLPGQYEEWSRHSRVCTLRDAMPFATQLIGLRKFTGEIVCIDGHHRAMALALAFAEGKGIDFSNAVVTIALADLAEGEEDLLDAVLERGSANTFTLLNNY